MEQGKSIQRCIKPYCSLKVKGKRLKWWGERLEQLGGKKEMEKQ